jgi:predicted nucleic acid-binding protein
MAYLFVDTWGWLTLRDKSERRHAEMWQAFESFQQPEHRIFTSDFVLDETFTLLFRRLPFAAARESMELLATSMDEGSLVSIPITGTRFKAAQALRLRYQDKPAISFTDLTSMAVMQEFNIQKILTEDNHFAQVGLGFELIH